MVFLARCRVGGERLGDWPGHRHNGGAEGGHVYLCYRSLPTASVGKVFARALNTLPLPGSGREGSSGGGGSSMLEEATDWMLFQCASQDVHLSNGFFVLFELL